MTLLFCLLFSWNSMTYTITGFQDDLTRLVANKEQFFNSISLK